MLLIACPDCARQYDVTGLDPGRQVRCFCECLLTVDWPPKLTAAALTCAHCGGAVSTTDEACPYCQAAISEADRRRTTLCPACYTRLQDDSKHCRACGIDIRPQSLAPLPSDSGCPRCEGELRVRSLDVVDVVECRQCLGIWLTPESFKQVTVKAARESGAASLFPGHQDRPRPERRVEEVRYIPCLGCGELMQRRQYTHEGRGSRVVIDVCRSHGVWLDHEEVERIVDFIQTGGTPGIASRIPDPKPFIVSSSAPARGAAASPRGSILTEVLETIVDLVFWRG